VPPQRRYELQYKTQFISIKNQFIVLKAQKFKWGTKIVPQRYNFFRGTKWPNGVQYPKMGYTWQPCLEYQTYLFNKKNGKERRESLWAHKKLRRAKRYI